MTENKNSFRPQVEQLEDRVTPSASIFQLNQDVSRFASDVPAAVRTGIQGGVDIARGWYGHNQTLYSRGLNEYSSSVREIQTDYRQIQSDLSTLANVQSGIARLPTFQRMESDVGVLLEGGLVAVYGGVTLNKNVIQRGENIMNSAVSDFFAAINQTVTNVFHQDPGHTSIGYDENAPRW